MMEWGWAFHAKNNAISVGQRYQGSHGAGTYLAQRARSAVPTPSTGTSLIESSHRFAGMERLQAHSGEPDPAGIAWVQGEWVPLDLNKRTISLPADGPRQLQV